MKINKIVVSLFTAGLMASPLANATNGDHMMAAGSQNSALGGTGVAHFVGAESAFANPAMLGKSKGSEVTGGFVLFKPAVTNTGMPGGAAQSSTSDTSYIPDISYSSRSSDSLSYGVAMGGIAGMGVDYTGANAATHIKAKSALSILRVVPTVAYNDNDYGFGFSPVFQYGSLMLSYNNGAAYNGAENADTDTGFGYSLGGFVNVTPDLTLAAAYQSAIKMQYGTQISGAGTGFGLCSPPGGPCTGLPTFGDDLTQPAEMRVGISSTMDNITVTADYKLIKWGSADGYKDFNWEDQKIIAVGAKYDADGYWLGLGYNHANDPIVNIPNAGAAPPSDDYRKSAINFFNNMFFPAVVESSYTFGGGFSMTKELDIEGSVVITPEVTKTVDVPHFGGTNTSTHSQKAYSVSLRYKF